MNLKIIKGINNNINEIKEMYKNNFNLSDQESNTCFEKFINHDDSHYGVIDSKIVCVIYVTIKSAIINENELCNIANIQTICDCSDDANMLLVLKEAISFLENKYDCVSIQSNNWDKFKTLDLIDSSIRNEYSFNKGGYPTPMLMVWNTPEVGIIKGIEESFENSRVGINNTEEQITSKIEVMLSKGYKWFGNPFAYVWYNDKNEVVDLCYNHAHQLIWLLNTIQPNGLVILDSEEINEKVKQLTLISGPIIITKVTKNSKKKLKDIKLPYYFI